MSCHSNRVGTGDWGIIWICTAPIMGFCTEEQWIAEELRLFGNKGPRAQLAVRLAGLTKAKEEEKQ